MFTPTERDELIRLRRENKQLRQERDILTRIKEANTRLWRSAGGCREAGVRPSMGSVGDAYDNAMCESFFATLECELLERRRFASQAEAKMACFSFIEGWYNPVRLHSALGYRSPMAYEAMMEVVTTEP